MDRMMDIQGVGVVGYRLEYRVLFSRENMEQLKLPVASSDVDRAVALGYMHGSTSTHLS